MSIKNPFDYDLRINVCGITKGNPGVMAIGGIIYRSGKVIETFEEELEEGTKNEAEYKAIIKALNIAFKYDPLSVIILSNSQIAVNQLNGIYKAQEMSKFYSEVKLLKEEFEATVDFMWVSKDENKEAEALASKKLGMPKANTKDAYIIFWTKDMSVPYEKDKLEALPKPKEECYKMINSINSKDNARTRDYLDLKTFGQDKYSRMENEMLKEAVKIRFGEYTLRWLEDTLEDEDSNYSKNVYKWTARGLNPDKAIEKVTADIERASKFIVKNPDKEIVNSVC